MGTRPLDPLTVLVQVSKVQVQLSLGDILSDHSSGKEVTSGCFVFSVVQEDEHLVA